MEQTSQLTKEVNPQMGNAAAAELEQISSAPIFRGAAQWRKTLRRKNELLGEVLNELISRDSLDDSETLTWMCEYVVEARVALAALMEDLKSITDDASGEK